MLNEVALNDAELQDGALAPAADPAQPPRGRLAGRWPGLTVAVTTLAVALVAAGVWWGWRVQLEPRVKLGAAPLVGSWEWRPGWGLAPAAVVAVVCVLGLPRAAASWRWTALLAVTGFAAAGFTLLLASADGWSRLLDPVVDPTEYWTNLRSLPPAGEMLREYGSVDFLLDYSVHVKGHPPGFLLVQQALSGVGLGRPWVTGSLSIVAAGALPVAVLTTVRATVDERAARRVTPFLVLVPYVVWLGISADAVFASVAACGVAATALALRSSSPAGRRVLAVTAGLVLAFSVFLTYGAAVLALVPVALVLLLPGVAARARAEVAVASVVGAGAVALAFLAAGFWWLDGLTATQTLYWWGTAQFRPGGYFFVANLAALTIAVGPAVAVGIGSLRDRRVWLLVGAALVCVLVANLSHYSKGETERIWLVFFPWLVPATVALRRPGRWLAVQAAVTVVLQAWLVSKW